MAEAPRKTWIYVLAGVIPAVVIISMAAYVISRAVSDMGVKDGGQKVTALCMSRLAKVGQAQFLYAADNDDRLPPAEHWVDATWKYVGKKDPDQQTESPFKCPSISIAREGTYGYAFNLDLDSKAVASIGYPGETELLFDSKAMFRNAAGPPVAAYPVEGRHNGGKDIVVAYANGSVKVEPRK